MLTTRCVALIALIGLAGCPMKNSDPEPDGGGGTAGAGGEGGGGDEMTKLPPPDAAPPDPGKPLAEGCATNAECASGFCADGVCCNSACDQPCFTCHTTGSYGSCLPQITGEDSTATPACSGAKTCGLNPNLSTGSLSVCALKDLQACTVNSACASNNCVLYWADQDGDGWGNTAAPIRVCNEPGAAAPSGFSSRSGDCCDTDNNSYPGADGTYWPYANACGSFDYDCDGVIEQLYPNVTCAATNGAPAEPWACGTTTCSAKAFLSTTKTQSCR
jgi:hypothetical protein